MLTSALRKDFENDLSARKAELAAALGGTWPRNWNDEFRFPVPVMPKATDAEKAAARLAHVIDVSRKDIAWLKARLQEGARP